MNVKHGARAECFEVTCDGPEPSDVITQRRLTCVLEARPHAFVQLAPPLPGSQLLVLVAGLQWEAVSLRLSRQVRRPPLSLQHQRAQVGLPTLHAHDCNREQTVSAAVRPGSCERSRVSYWSCLQNLISYNSHHQKPLKENELLVSSSKSVSWLNKVSVWVCETNADVSVKLLRRIKTAAGPVLKDRFKNFWSVWIIDSLKHVETESRLKKTSCPLCLIKQDRFRLIVLYSFYSFIHF